MALRKLLNLENDPLVKVVFYFLAIRNETLEKHYPGGVIAFHERHGGVIGYYVSIISWMGHYWDGTVEDLSLYGLKQDKDWILEEEQLTEGLENTPSKAFEVEMPVSWLRGWGFPKQGMFVYYSPIGRYPYVILRLLPAVYQPFQVIFTKRDLGQHNIIQVPVDLPFEQGALTSHAKKELENQIIGWRSELKLRKCLVYGPKECVYFEPDGTQNRLDEPPSGGLWNV